MSKQILIVEDDPSIREILEEILGLEGFQAIAAQNGQVALDLLRGGARPNLIILDLMMPIKDGFQFRREQLADPAIANIPVVIMSAAGNLEEKVAETKAVGCLKKPVELSEFIEALEKYCP